MSIYKERAVAFMDILGMRSIISRINSDDAIRINLHGVLNLIKQQERYSKINANDLSDMQVSVFSDCIAISISPEKISSLICVCSNLQDRILHLGFAVRGGITVGRTIHADGLLYGEGIVRAHEIESIQAKNPRILLDENLEARYPILISSEYLDWDDDSRRIVTPMVDTPFWGNAAELAAEGYDPRELFMSEVRRHLVRNLVESNGKNFYEKWIWLADRFNQSIRDRRCFPDLLEIDIQK
jgi:hypothetical protein